MARYPIIDTHVHLWNLTHPALRYDWLQPDAVHPILGDINAIKSVAYEASALQAESRFADVTAFVHVQAAIGSDDPVEETRWLTAMYAEAGMRGAIVAYVDLSADDAAAVTDGHAQSTLFSAIRDFGTEPYLASGEVDERYERSLQMLASREIVLDLDCEWKNMAAAAELAARHPQLRIVLEHIGYPRRRDPEYFANWSGGIARLASAENVVCKISGLGMTERLFTRQSLAPWIERCLELFGPRRCVIGSNWPVDRISSSYDVIMDVYRDSVGTLSQAEQRAVLADNAARIYRVQDALVAGVR
jgi:predicted TIM-barrel fold metal-dependent hydrolase